MENEKIVKRKSGKSKKKFVVLTLILLVSIVALYFFVQYKETHISTDDAYVTNDIFWVNPRVSGNVVKVFVDDNQYVKKGDMIALIDEKPYKAALDQAEAQLKLAQAKEKETQAALKSQKSEINLIKAKLDKALWDFNRAKKLIKAKSISEDRYEQYLTNYNVLKFTLKSQNDVLSQVKASLLSAKRNIDAAKAGVEMAKLNLLYTKIKSPADGLITKKSVEVGKFASPAIPVCAVVPNKNAWIVANYKEGQIEKMRKGQKVKIKMDTYSGKTFEGRIESVQFGTGEVFSLFPPQNASGNWIKVTQRIPVKIVFNKPPNVALRVGMSADVTVLIKK